MITVSIKARIFIQSALEDQAKKYCFLSILSGGCNGLQYSIEFIDKIITNNSIYHINVDRPYALKEFNINKLSEIK